ncbi:MAG: malto-oligosyltrehalose trehalohydrolase [Actinomycetaceae bacterium]|nr:malto-oligosyltrehalose trehalohydrolase [Actinomycetaceae bacterium]MDY6083280.1 malto-oligosyltrehalose trehalohydrolase [Actinomycetaceae bacterium]
MKPAVWAPHATTVDLLQLPSSLLPHAADEIAAHAQREGLGIADLFTQRHPLKRSCDGSSWWRADTDLPEGTLYYFSVDGGNAFPDPRTQRQPYGVHGPSQVIDVTQFEWNDSAWFEPHQDGQPGGISMLGAIAYEIHIGTFTPDGSFASAELMLPYLKDLGIDAVEIMPIAPVPGSRNWGYDGVENYAVTENYGGPAAFAHFVNAAHRVGLGVVLDVVYNHQGPEGNYLNTYGPYFSDAHSSPWGQSVNLDGSQSSGMRSWILDNALQWVRDYHVDALRLDAVPYLRDDSSTHILQELANTVHSWAASHHRWASLIAESDLNDARMVTPTSQGGMGMDAQWDDDVHHALHATFLGEDFGYYSDFAQSGTLEKAMTHVFVHDGDFSSFRGRTWGHPVPDSQDPRHFTVMTQDHDQVGNRAIGDRPHYLHSLAATAIEDALAILSPYSPLIFMGQEWAAHTPFQFFTDYDDELGKKVAQGRRDEFRDFNWTAAYGHEVQIPDPQAKETFADSQLKWSEPLEAEHRAYLAFYRALISARKSLVASEPRTELNADLTTSDSNLSTFNGVVVRRDTHGYYRRGRVWVVFSLDPDAHVVIPVSTVSEVATWGRAEISSDYQREETHIAFHSAGVHVLVH